jgi:CTP:molybdopterin cytidylyltransferase MocA
MTFCIILAAGASKRMGSVGPKALLKTPDGRTFIVAIAETARAAGCKGVIAVLGPPHGEQIAVTLPSNIAAVFNHRPERGMLSSVQTGLAALPPTTTGVLVWPVDMPLVTEAAVKQILAAASDQIVVPEALSDGQPRGGHPVYIPGTHFRELLLLPHHESLRTLIAAHPPKRLRVTDSEVLKDIDTPADIPRS